jgi:mono/diheme cytochrome c family protein
MKRSLIYAAVLATATAFAAIVGDTAPAFAQGTNARTAAPEADKVVRGRYLVTTSACHDCHTPWHEGANGPEPDMSRMLSGHPEKLVLPAPPKPEGPWIISAAATMTAWSGPWGVSYTANLTPDPETGLGKWTQRNFIEAIRTGRHMGRGREVLPPMPIQVYRNFTDADLEAIYAFLRTIPPIRNRVPEPLPPAEPLATTK